MVRVSFGPAMQLSAVLYYWYQCISRDVHVQSRVSHIWARKPMQAASTRWKIGEKAVVSFNGKVVFHSRVGAFTSIGCVVVGLHLLTNLLTITSLHAYCCQESTVVRSNRTVSIYNGTVSNADAVSE